VEPQKTPFYDEHVRLGGKMADFAGWLMPLWYSTGQSREHHAVRNAAGLFDICHMGEFEAKGPGTLRFFSRMLTNNVEKMADGQAMYHFMLNEQGGVIDDCILYRFDEKNWMLVVNAGDIEGDFNWLQSHATSDVELKNISSGTVKLDLQGPKAPKILSRWMDAESLKELKFFRFLPNVPIGSAPVLVSRTGYTGEVGFELYTDLSNGKELWDLLMREGEKEGLLPCGLGARDTLRTEAGLPLCGHELRADKIAVGHPWEFAIDFESDFLGRDILLSRKEQGIDYFVYPFIMEGKRKAMPGWEVLRQDRIVGTVLSGVISPTLENRPIGFVGVNQELETETGLVFRQPGKDLLMKGKTTVTPFVPLTSRKKMERFL